MDDKLNSFLKLHEIFLLNNKNLYLVGGTVRDFLLGLPLNDMDLVTDATPKEMKLFLKDADYTFEKMGSIKYVFEETKFDITTLRKEKNYKDARHPNKIEFVTSLKDDFKRRDFTINAMYMDNHFRLIDFCDGIKDINSKTLRMVGNPDKRIKEDPLRISRAIRFALDYDLSIEDKLLKAIKSNVKLLNGINPYTLKRDYQKMKCQDEAKKNKLFNEIGVSNIFDVIK